MIDDQFIIEIWDIFKEYVPEKMRETAATQFVDFLDNFGVSSGVLEGVLGYDPDLDRAIETILDQEDEESEDEEDYDDEFTEDEDY